MTRETGIFLAVLMVVSLVAMTAIFPSAATAQATNGSHSASTQQVAPGENVIIAVTVEITEDSDGNGFQFNEQISPAIGSNDDNVVFEELRVDGSPVSEGFAVFGTSGGSVTGSGVSSGDTLTAVYTVQVPDDDSLVGNSYSFGGDFEYNGATVGTGSTTVEVVDRGGTEPNFEVSNLTPDGATITQGDDLTASATVQNTGDAAGSQTIEAAVDGYGVLAQRQVDLDVGESRTVEETISTSGIPTGSYTLTIQSADDSQSGTVTIEDTEQEPSFEVDIDESASTLSAAEGDTVDVVASIQNTGSTGSQVIEFTFGGQVRDSTTVDLDSGSSTTVSFSATLGDDDDGASVTVGSPDDSATATVSLLGPALDVSIDEAASTLDVDAGGTAEVVATVTNTRDASVSQDVELAVGGQTRDSRSVDLDGGQSTAVTLQTTAQAGDDGAGAVVRAGESTASTTLSVTVETGFTLAFTSAPSSVDVGETFSIAYRLENVGDVSDTVDVGLSANGQSVASDTRQVAAQTAVSGTFSYTPNTQGTLELQLSGGDATATAVLQVAAGDSQDGEDSEDGQDGEDGEDSEDGQDGEDGEDSEDGQDGEDGEDSEDGQDGEDGEDSEDGAATVSVEPQLLEFDDVRVGASETATLAITASGGTANLSDVEVMDGGDVFSVGEAPDAVGTEETVDLEITYAPEERGNHTGAVGLYADGQLAATIDLNGSAVAGELLIEPQSVTFSDVGVNETLTQTALVENVGNAPVEVTRAELGDGAGDFSLSNGGEFALDVGEQRNLTVTFAPETGGPQSTYLYVESDIPTSQTQVVSVTSGDVSIEVDIDDQNRTTANASIRNASGGNSHDISLPNPTEEEDFETNVVSIVPEDDQDQLRVNVTTSSKTLETTPNTTEGLAPNTTMVGNISAEANVNNNEISETTFNTTISKDQLDELGADAEDMFFFRFNESLEEWVRYEGVEVINETETDVRLRLTTDRFSEWTAAAARPEFEITDTSVNVETAELDEAVTIDVFVQNIGGTEGTYVADLLLEGEIVDSQRANIAADGEVQFQFERSFDQPGTYQVQVNEVPISDVEITESSVDTDPADGDDDGSDADGGDGEETTREDTEPEGDDDGGDGGFPWGIFVLLAVLVIAAGAGVWYYTNDEEFGGNT